VEGYAARRHTAWTWPGSSPGRACWSYASSRMASLS
jgi:hypothetical protein